jgi:hypothetical protein
MIRLRAFWLLLFLLLCGGVSAQNAASPGTRSAQVREHLREILSASEYRFTPPESGFWAQAGKWLSDLLEKVGKLFRFSPPSRGGLSGSLGGNVVFWLILIALCALMVYLIYRVVRKLPRNRAPRKPKNLTETSDLLPVLESDPVSDEPDQWLTTARRHAAEGDYRKAQRAVFVALLLRLDRLGIVRFDRSFTNGEYLRSLRSRPTLFPLVRAFANEFDSRWYGGVPATEADYQRGLETYQQIVQRETASG